MRGRVVHYQFEENKQLPKDVIEVLVKSCQFDNSVQKFWIILPNLSKQIRQFCR